MLHVRQSTETICQLSGMGASDTKTSSIHGSDDVEVNYRGTLTNLSKTKNTNRKRKGQTERDGVPIRLQDSCQQMGLMNSGSCILDSCHVLQQEFQGKLGSKSRAQDILWCSAEYGEMGQLNSVFPIHDGFYGNQQASEGHLRSLPTRVGHNGTQQTEQSMQGMILDVRTFHFAKPYFSGATWFQSTSCA
ncbi:protein FAR-RED ELONGATED HYPOCOTYL 3-like isoform X2 [Argentina anserina]|uniref:protein FAR-RED ELONGATED HYPOCOTYL 3-like isoform X2 n=1 Tax=Argentina anserina TaxID=57926 RepID=UPI002176280D|nr:protein FAR-RED ELONGATED HYPOCOTYL 3-like isoform X2 [Potentilla anserina]XP_050381668.1 protein FAR-RED ELONGATED HYPOCOTYL 3-like isoform X2 [Potentilla anserina]